MKSDRWLGALAALVGAALPAPALAETDRQLWLGATAQAEIDPAVLVQADTSVRFSDKRHGLYQVVNTVLLGHRISRSVAVWAGYVVSPSYVAGHLEDTEHRVRAQLTFAKLSKVGPAQLSGRLRYEQRWRDAQPGTASRLMPQLRLALPLGKAATAPTLNVTTEGHFDLNTTSFQSEAGLERFRLGTGLSVPLSRRVKLDLGVLEQHRIRRGRTDVGEHIVTAGLNVAL